MAKSNLYLLQFNNYFNRKIKKLDTVQDYINQSVYILQGCSFNPNDGVTTEHVLNEAIPCDYLIETDVTGTELISRWYVTEATRLRNGQYRLRLYRDLLVDYMDEIKASTCFIIKGYVQQTSPFIFNNENMGFNQIKTKEVLLKNKLDTPWIVAYLARYNNEGEYNSFTGSFKSVAYDGYDYTVNALSDYKYHSDLIQGGGFFYESTSPYFTSIYNVEYTNASGTIVKRGYIITISQYGITQEEIPSQSSLNIATLSAPLDLSNAKYENILSVYEQATVVTESGLIKNTYSNRGTQSGANTLAAENGKVIKTADNTYRISIENATFNQAQQAIVVGSALYNKLAEEIYGNVQHTGGDYLFVLPAQNLPQLFARYNIIGAYNPSYSIKYDSTITRDAQYEILATPFNNVTFTVDKTGTQFYHDGTIALEWFQDIANRYKSSGYCYDVQIVPYVNIDNADVSTQNQVKLGNSCIAFKLTQSSFTYANEITIPMRADKKIGNECDLYRICSPNGIGEYEFNPYKNGGFGTFEADVTLLPVNPYIQIHPIWGELYGDGSIEDFRGLICGGDFSLGNTSNEWLSYQQQNKYYQAIFDRNIESQEINNNISREREQWQVATGAIQGAVTGAIGGGSVGGIIGGVAGAVIGGGASLAAGLKDMELNERSRSEAISLQKDQFGYQLGTMKARTTQLAKTTAFNVDSKYFPYVEYWTCTDAEVSALEKKLKYNGMTVGVIDMLSKYLNPSGETFIQAQLIEIDIDNDSNLVNAIARNLAEGVRI